MRIDCYAPRVKVDFSLAYLPTWLGEEETMNDFHLYNITKRIGNSRINITYLHRFIPFRIYPQFKFCYD